MKKIVSILIVILLVMSVTGCQKEKGDIVPETTYQVNEDDLVDIFEEETTKNQDAEINSISGYGKITINKMSDFSEDLAWFTYRNNITYDYSCAVVNKNGEIIYTAYENVEEYSPFEGGYSFYSTKNGEYKIVDSNGCVTVTSDDGIFETIIAASNGMFVVQKQYSDISTNKYYWAIIDGKGNYIVDYFEAPISVKGYGSAHRYIGEDYFLMRFGNGEDIYLINTKTGDVTKPLEENGFNYGWPTWEDELKTNFENGKAIVRNNGHLYVMDRRFNKTPIYGDKLVNIHRFGYYGDIKHHLEEFDRYEDDLTSGFSEGLFYINRSYYDYDGKVILNIDIYEENIVFGGTFEKGYAPLFIGGKDGKSYVTIIDKKGNAQFEPVDIEDAWFELADGKLLIKKDGRYKLLDCEGNISGDIRLPGTDDLFIYSYFDGILILQESTGNPCLVINIEDSVVIGSATNRG